MDTFLSFHGEDEVTVKLDLNKRLASQQGLKALDTFGSRKDLLNEEEKVHYPSFQIFISVLNGLSLELALQ